MRSIPEALHADVDAAASIPVGSLGVAQLQELILATSQEASRLVGIASRTVAELEARGGGVVPAKDGGSCGLPAWLRVNGNLSSAAAGSRVHTAVALRELPQVTEAIIDGTVTLEHGRVLARLVGNIDPEQLRASQPALLEVARHADPTALGHYVRHLLATWCEPVLVEDEAAAQDRRFLQLTNGHNGSWRGRFSLPDGAMETLLSALEPLARREGLGDERSAGQRRADALVDVFGLALAHADLPDAGGSRPRLTYVIPAAWAIDLPDRISRFRIDLDRPAAEGCAAGAWTGPATRSLVATLACDSRVEHLTVNPTGRIASLESFTEQPTKAQRRALAARDRGCAARGCTRPPAFCDAHHLRALADGGATTTDNMVLLCRRHHTAWHRGEITLTTSKPPGSASRFRGHHPASSSRAFTNPGFGFRRAQSLRARACGYPATSM
ncbi:MAG: DUF222 domain-containing protein [Mycobacteriales bacterium]